MSTWVNRWRYWVAEKPTRENIYRQRDGGFLVRVGNTTRSLPNASLDDAVTVRNQLVASSDNPSMPLFCDFALSVFEERVLAGDIASESTKERWKDTLRHYLLPAFGHLRVDRLNNATIATWKKLLSIWIRKGKPSAKDPAKRTSFAESTANGHMRVLRTLCTIMKTRYELRVDPFEGISFFREPNSYGPGNPNSLTPDLLRAWLELARVRYKQHFAAIALGFVTGRRPGELRALYKTDIDWKRNQLTIQRSTSRGQELKPGTKTGDTVLVTLPQEIVDILREHIDSLPEGPMRDSKLLFPATHGGVRSRSALDKPFRNMKDQLGIKFRVTPRAMRRSFQDLARAAEVEGVVTMSISGHKTPKMKDHYSTVYAEEQRAGIQRIVDMVKSDDT